MADSIVETIIVKLGLDVSSYNPDADKAVKKTDQLTGSLEKTDKKTSTVGKTLTRVFASSAILIGIGKIVDEVAKLNDQLFFLEKNLGMSSQTIQAWQGAASAMGGSADGMTSSMKSLNMALNDFVVMGDSSMLPYMNALGVSMVDVNGKVRDTDKVMLDLADSFSKIDREQAFSLASKMGIDEGTFNTLVEGRQEMEKMIEYQKTMYKSSEAELKVSRDLQRNRALLGSQWQSMKTMMANALIPLFLKASEVLLGMFEYLQRHQEAVKAVFIGIATALTIYLIPALLKATVAALAFIAPFAPFILVVGALGAAFGLLYNDYKVWAEGGKSLFDWGAFRDYIDNSTLSTNNLRNAFNNLTRDMLSGVIPTLKGYADIVRLLSQGEFKAAGALAIDMLGNFGSRVGGVIDDVTGNKQGGFIESAGNLLFGGTGASTSSGGSSAGQSMASGVSKLEARGGSGKKAEFVQKYLPAAKAVGEKLGVPPEALLGQWALETGWGKSITKGTGYNLGNIKAGSKWQGKSVRAYDRAEKSNDLYRVYDTPEAFAEDYVQFLSKSKRYKNALGSSNAQEFFTGLKKGGYATDPKYIQSGMAITNDVMKELKTGNAMGAQRSMQQGTTSAPRVSNSSTNRSTKVDVNIDQINVKTSADTLASTALAGIQSGANQIFQMIPASN